MTNEELYQRCREVVAEVKEFQTIAAVHKCMGEPIQRLPIGDFFITNPDLSVSYCDLVELYHYRDCAIRVGYLNDAIVKVRGKPLAHWTHRQESK